MSLDPTIRQRLVERYGEEKTQQMITDLDAAVAEGGTPQEVRGRAERVLAKHGIQVNLDDSRSAGTAIGSGVGALIGAAIEIAK